jgi:hypothetical protein
MKQDFVPELKKVGCGYSYIDPDGHERVTMGAVNFKTNSYVKSESERKLDEQKKHQKETKMKTIAEIQIGHTFISPRNGEGMITAKTKRTLKATFKNGNTVKNTYRTADAYFYGSEF